MSDASTEARIRELSAKVDLLIFSYRIGTLAVLFFLSFINVSDSFAITWFHGIYQDALPGKPLPPITEFLIHYHALVGGFALLCPVLGTFTALVIKNISASISCTTCIMIVIVLQITITWFFLILPMFS